MKDVMTATEVRAAYAEIDRLNEDTRITRWRGSDNDRAIAIIRERIERSHILALHELHDRKFRWRA